MAQPSDITKALLTSLALVAATACGGGDDPAADMVGGDEETGAPAGDTDPADDPDSEDETDGDEDDGDTDGDTDGGGADDDGSGGSDGSDDSDSGTDDGSDDDAGSGSDDSTGEPGQAEPPEIVSVSPELDELGVPEDAEIIVEFNVPMDTLATENAYESLILPTDEVSFSWNEDQTVLTITPDEPLAYAEGNHPNFTNPMLHRFGFADDALSADGLPLGEEFESEFYTLRRIHDTLYTVDDLSSCMYVSGETYPADYLGDFANGEMGQCYYNFDATSLDSSIVEFESGTLRAERGGLFGNPFTDLGVVLAQHVSYGAIGPNLPDEPSIGTAAALWSDAATEEVEADVVDWIVDVHENPSEYNDRLQVRLAYFFAFQLSESDGDETGDGITIIGGSALAVDLTYLIP